MDETMNLLDKISLGFIELPWYGYLAVALILTHITIAAVTIYLHRYSAHKSLELNFAIKHFFRFWLWLTTGMKTKNWTAIHRKHHAKCETEDDPHSPQILTLKKVFFEGAELYRKEGKNKETLDNYGHGTPDDWLEKHIYSHDKIGVSIMLIINLCAFGAMGLTIWAIQMLWIPLFAAGVINGVGHYFGYRNFSVADASTNIIPLGILIGGEELHNNHHAFASSAKLSSKWYEFDIGWFYIKLLCFLNLAIVKKVAPKASLSKEINKYNNDLLNAIITNRYDVINRFRKAIKKLFEYELNKVMDNQKYLSGKINFNKFSNVFLNDKDNLNQSELKNLENTLKFSSKLVTVYEMKNDLTKLWQGSNLSTDQLLDHLKQWCKRAELSNITPLQDFTSVLRRYKTVVN